MTLSLLSSYLFLLLLSWSVLSLSPRIRADPSVVWRSELEQRWWFDLFGWFHGLETHVRGEESIEIKVRRQKNRVTMGGGDDINDIGDFLLGWVGRLL